MCMRAHLAHVAIEILDHSPNFLDTLCTYMYVCMLYVCMLASTARENKTKYLFPALFLSSSQCCSIFLAAQGSRLVATSIMALRKYEKNGHNTTKCNLKFELTKTEQKNKQKVGSAWRLLQYCQLQDKNSQVTSWDI